MGRISNIKWLPVLMGITIVGIATFQVFWLDSTYEREQRTLELRTNMLFRETVYALQAAKLRLDTTADADSAFNFGMMGGGMPMMHRQNPSDQRIPPEQKMANVVNMLRDRVTDSLKAAGLPPDSIRRLGFLRQNNRIIRFMYELDATQDTVTIAEIINAMEPRLDSQGLAVPFTVTRHLRDRERRAYNEATLGFINPVTYRLQLTETGPYLLRRIVSPIILSLFIVGFTTLSFIILYRNLLRQERLTDIKNEFISNITHELKTPIATVSVAIEALRSFNASMDARRTKEYLDISHNELQRLSLLVDKVLKLSIFEKKEVDLKYERINTKDLIDEVTASMRLQFEKYKAQVSVHAEGDNWLEADRLHLVSVLFNLIDNALKYSAGQPHIKVVTKGGADTVDICIEDNGIGIPKEYRDKVFDKFFRVPTGNLHNAKGYGLGLSYVAHVIEKHRGTIRVEPAEGRGSRFLITLPKRSA